MKYILAITTLALSTILVGQQKEVVVPFSSTEDDKSLNIRLMSGEIKVKGTDRNDVLIRYEVEERGDDDENDGGDDKSRGMKKIGGGNFEFEIGEKRNQVYVRSQNWMNIIRLEIEVPREISVDISKQIGEHVTVENINGDVNVENNVGNVTVLDVSGAVNASSSAGEILVNFTKIDPDQSMTFNTVTGNIDLQFPSTHKANLKMRTQWGDIYSDLPVTTTERKDEAEVKKVGENGMKVVSNNWTYGALNGGGPEMIIKTQMGSIYLRAKE